MARWKCNRKVWPTSGTISATNPSTYPLFHIIAIYFMKQFSLSFRDIIFKKVLERQLDKWCTCSIYTQLDSAKVWTSALTEAWVPFAAIYYCHFLVILVTATNFWLLRNLYMDRIWRLNLFLCGLSWQTDCRNFERENLVVPNYAYIVYT